MRQFVNRHKYKVMEVHHSQSFVYKWTHIPTGKWYIGSRTAKECHPDDGYIFSSNLVKHLIEEYPEDWIREILHIGMPNDMVKLEGQLLVSLNAKDDPNSFNQHNNNGKFRYMGGKSQTTVHRQKISKALTGIVRSDEYKQKQSLAKKGKSNPKHSLATKGVPKPNVSKAKKGVAQPKVLCRIKDRKEMCLSHFNRWCNRQDNPEILQAIFAKTRGQPKSKSVCRLIDKREMTLGHYERWIRLQG